MKIHKKLDETLKHGSKLKILRMLFMGKDDFTGREIAKAINMSASSTHKSLKDLVLEGMVSARKKGNAILYKIKTEHYVVKELLSPLFKKESIIYDKLVLDIKNSFVNKNVITLAVFGSVAKKNEKFNSDIDILIVTENLTDKKNIDKAMDKLFIKMFEKYNVSLSPYILTVKELKDMHIEKKPIIKAILNNNKLVYGEPIERLIA